MLDTIMREDAWGVMPEPLIRHLLREQKLSVIKHTYGLTQEDYCMFTAAGMAETPRYELVSGQDQRLSV